MTTKEKIIIVTLLVPMITALIGLATLVFERRCEPQLPVVLTPVFTILSTASGIMIAIRK